jgi:hypothetical protein
VEITLAALGAALTLLILSYLIGDNPLFRLALHILVGVSAAYIGIVALRSVILPALTPPDNADSAANLLWSISLVGGLLGALLLVRGVAVAKVSALGGVAVAVLVGVGVGVALAGAISGTMVPQLDAATRPAVTLSPLLPEALEPLGQIVAVVGTATGLLVFSFTGQRSGRQLTNRLLNSGSTVGRWFVLIGFGAILGGVLTASLALLADRVHYLIEVLELISGG